MIIYGLEYQNVPNERAIPELIRSEKVVSYSIKFSHDNNWEVKLRMPNGQFTTLAKRTGKTYKGGKGEVPVFKNKSFDSFEDAEKEIEKLEKINKG